VDHTITLDTSSAALVAWLESPSFSELVFLVQVGSYQHFIPAVRSPQQQVVH